MHQVIAIETMTTDEVIFPVDLVKNATFFVERV